MSVENIERINPNTLKEARNMHDWPKWKEAYFSELDSILEWNVLEIFTKKYLPKQKLLIKTHWFFTKKFNENGQLQRYKAQCVARGFEQKEGIDYQETFSPTGRLSTLRYIINYTVQTRQNIRKADFVTTLLNSELNEEESVYTTLPEGFVDWINKTKLELYEHEKGKNLLSNPQEHILKLKKSLYGLKQAAQSWYLTLQQWLNKNNFILSPEDPFLFTCKNTILIRDLINNREINLKYLETGELVADCLTKALDRIKQQKFNKYMRLFEYTSGKANIEIKQDNDVVNSPLKLRGRVGRTINKSELENVLSRSEESNKIEKLIDKKYLVLKVKIMLLDDFIGYNIKREVSLESQMKKLTKQRKTS
ncbi:hypothetical protein O181_014133 [Austropuccinia psidii MF-1]|uniref:Reverse transcriptase Ty1/copia-type domain-containing protein n=1 Tax=Austropuccinia psidii MF-1 TaxID=1389203 RepID=A0A9Q3C0M4_9BASI|nr:hypothetical protein [Austropuccinia psidii MF-1]